MRKYTAIHFAIYLVSFFLLHYILLMILDGRAEDTGWKYPYDLVVCAEEPIRFEEKHSELPFVTVTDGDGRKYIGISQSDYSRLTGKSPGLGRNEVMLINQMGEEGYKEQEDREISFAEIDGDNIFHVIREKNEILFCGYQTDLLYIVVFQPPPVCGQEEVFYLFQGDAASDAEASINKMSGEKIRIWKKAELLERERQEENIHLFFYYGIALLIVIFGNGIMTVILCSNISEMKRQYEFYACIGMEKRKQRKKIRAEISGSVLFPEILALAASILFFAIDIGGNATAIFVKTMGTCYMAFLFIEYAYTKTLEIVIRRYVRG